MMPQVPLGEVEKHFWLTRSVARCMGVSLTEAMAAGNLSAEDYANMVTRCRASDCSKRCQFWLSKQQARAQTAPEFCANAETFASLT